MPCPWAAFFSKQSSYSLQLYALLLGEAIPSKEKTPAFLPSGSHWWAQLGNPSDREKQWAVISFRASLSTSLHPQPLIPRWSCVCVSQSCLTLCDPTDYSLPGSSVHRISQARILEWFAIPFSMNYIYVFFFLWSLTLSSFTSCRLVVRRRWWSRYLIFLSTLIAKKKLCWTFYQYLQCLTGIF